MKQLTPLWLPSDHVCFEDEVVVIIMAASGRANSGNNGNLHNSDSNGDRSNSSTMVSATFTASSAPLLTHAKLPVAFQKTGHWALSNKAWEPFCMEAT